jgi:glycine cleavage system H protein
VLNPNNLQYTASHEWLRTEADGTITVGITHYAQDHLGELVYVELPAAGSSLSAGTACAVVESTKAAADVYAPASGTVVAVNEALASAPQTVNEAPFTEGWLFRINPTSAPAGLMDANAYAGVVAAAS